MGARTRITPSSVAAALAIGLSAVSCGGGSTVSPSTPSAPSVVSPVTVAGSWSGTATDSSGSGVMAWQLTQTGTSFSGTLSMTDDRTTVRGTGTVSGTLSGPNMQFP